MGRATAAHEVSADALAAYIRRIVAEAPAPTPAQVQRLRDLLPPVAATRRAA